MNLSTTTSGKAGKPLTLAKLENAIARIKPPERSIERIVCNRRGWRVLNGFIRRIATGNFWNFYGISIYLDPNQKEQFRVYEKKGRMKWL